MKCVACIACLFSKLSLYGKQFNSTFKKLKFKNKNKRIKKLVTKL